MYATSGLANYNAFFDNPVRRKLKNSDVYNLTFGGYFLRVVVSNLGYRSSTAIFMHNSSMGATAGFWADLIEKFLPETLGPNPLEDANDCNHTLLT